MSLQEGFTGQANALYRTEQNAVQVSLATKVISPNTSYYFAQKGSMYLIVSRFVTLDSDVPTTRSHDLESDQASTFVAHVDLKWQFPIVQATMTCID